MADWRGVEDARSNVIMATNRQILSFAFRMSPQGNILAQFFFNFQLVSVMFLEI